MTTLGDLIAIGGFRWRSWGLLEPGLWSIGLDYSKLCFGKSQTVQTNRGKHGLLKRMDSVIVRKRL